MKVKIDEKNKVCIAYGSFRGKKIKAVAVCKEPEFDKIFGEKLARRKYKVKETYAKLKWHQSIINEMNQEIERLNAELKWHNKCADYLDSKLQKEIFECENIVDNYFNKLNEEK